MNISENIEKLQHIIGYGFKNLDLISIALFHHGIKRNTSFSAQFPDEKSVMRRFERIEFLGDRVLGLALADFLYVNFPDDNEGDLAIRIATLAGTDFLIYIAKKTKIIDCFFIPKDFFVSSNKNSSSIADMMEAVIGSIFLDSDFETTKKIIIGLWKDDIDKVSYKMKDSKTLLQEIAQAKSNRLPSYRLVKMSGESHDPIFEVEVGACGLSSKGYGNSKKNAEHNAAKNMLEILQIQNEKLKPR